MSFPIHQRKGMAYLFLSLFSIGLSCFSSSVFASSDFYWYMGNHLDHFSAMSRVVEIQVLTVSSELLPNPAVFNVALNENQQIVSMRYSVSPSESAEFSVAQLRSGVVLVRRSDRDVLKLRSTQFDAREGGELELTYLSDGIMNIYHTFKMSLVRTGGNWGLEVDDQSGRRPFSTMVLYPRKVFGQVIGIERIEVK